MASNSKVAKVGKSAKFITVQKWETELNCQYATSSELQKNGSSNFKFDKCLKGQSKCWKGKQHKRAADFQTKSKPIFHVTVKMKDTDSIRIKFNSAYYLAKMERPFSVYNNLLKL